ncbi:MAG: hypothetical protein HYT80_08125 [Euryarchaeota archaeon]|nr:hypothetical protein [Euryarchaeota archaeon]
MTNRAEFLREFRDRIEKARKPAFAAAIAGVHALSALAYAVMYLAETLDRKK